MIKFEMCDTVEVVNGERKFIGEVGKVLLTVNITPTEIGSVMVGFEDDRFSFFNVEDLKLVKKYYEQ